MLACSWVELQKTFISIVNMQPQNSVGAAIADGPRAMLCGKGARRIVARRCVVEEPASSLSALRASVCKAVQCFLAALLGLECVSRAGRCAKLAVARLDGRLNLKCAAQLCCCGDAHWLHAVVRSRLWEL
jgi:hypothetical protein